MNTLGKYFLKVLSTFTDSPVEIIANPTDLAHIAKWESDKKYSVYSFPVRIRKSAGTGQGIVDLEARCKIPKYLKNDSERKLTGKVKKLIEKKALGKSDINILQEYLTHKRFHRKKESNISLNFNLIHKNLVKPR